MSESKGKLTGDLRVRIIGGSIAGCAMAIELLRLGCQVTLFERTGEELKSRGAGIAVPPAVIDTFIQRDLVNADIPYFTVDKVLRLWRTSREKRYGHLAWSQPGAGVFLNWGSLSQGAHLPGRRCGCAGAPSHGRRGAQGYA